jgi:prepilin-type N-terminal cleavage/methylation domain-containing protein
MIGPWSLDGSRRFTASVRRGVSLLELTMAVMLLAIIAWVALPRIVGNSLDTKKNTCYINVRNLEVQAELWYRNNGTWPAADLSDMGVDSAYVPDGLPSCPVDGTAYTLDGTTHRVTGHDHP